MVRPMDTPILLSLRHLGHLTWSWWLSRSNTVTRERSLSLRPEVSSSVNGWTILEPQCSQCPALPGAFSEVSRRRRSRSWRRVSRGSSLVGGNVLGR